MTAFIEKVKRVCGSGALAWLLVLNSCLFLILWITVMVGNYFGASGNFTMQWLCVSSSVPDALTHAWTVLTYMATHYDFLHLLFNMLWLFWFGRILMITLTERHLLWLYIGGGLVGAAFYIGVQAVSPGLSPAGTYLCGASASVLAIIAGAAMRSPDLRLYLLIFGEVKLKWIAIGCILLTFAGIGGGNTGGQAAHVGGVLFGLGFAFALKKGFDPVKKVGEEVKMRRKAVLKVVNAPLQRGNVVRDGHAVAKAASGKLSDANRLDALLDKIRLSGYNSLTETERKELNALSQRLGSN